MVPRSSAVTMRDVPTVLRNRHGAKKKLCSQEGCTNHVVRDGVCVRHGAKVKRCNHEGCTNQVQKGGVCIKHGAKV